MVPKFETQAKHPNFFFFSKLRKGSYGNSVSETIYVTNVSEKLSS